MNKSQRHSFTILAISLAINYCNLTSAENDKALSLSIPSVSSILTGSTTTTPIISITPAPTTVTPTSTTPIISIPSLPSILPELIAPTTSSISVPTELHKTNTLQRSNGMQTISWSPDEKYLVTGAYYSTSTDLDIFYFDGTTITPTMQRHVGKPVHSVAWHPTLNYIAIGTAAGTVNGDRRELAIVQFIQSSGTLAVKDLKSVSSGHIYALAWHPSGTYLVVGSTSSPEISMYSFNINTGILTLLASAHLQDYPYLNSIRFSPDGNYMVIGTAQETLIYEFNSTALILKNRTLNGFASNTDWSCNSDFIATSLFTQNNSLQVYQYNRSNTNLTKLHSETPLETQNLFSVRWHPSQNCLATGSYTGAPLIKLYTLDSLTSTLILSQALASPDHIFALQWSPTGNYLASITIDRQITVYATIYTTIQQDAANLLDVTLGRNTYPLNTIGTVLYPYP